MSLYTTLVFVALAALGALIAYLGDLIGARVGKQRSSILGLRPRQSARLVAAIIGGLLPLLGLGVATIGSRYARAAVFELRTLLDQRKELQARIDELQHDVDRFEEQAASAEKRAEQAETAAEELKGIQEEQKERIEGLQEREGELQARAASLQDRVKGLTGRVESLTARRDTLEENLKSAQADLEKSERELLTAQSDVTATRAELEAKRREVEQKRKQVDDISLQLDHVKLELEDVNRQLEPTRDELQTASAELESLAEEKARLEEEYAEAEARLQSITRHEELVSRTPEGLFEPGYELLRVVQPAGRTQDQIEADLFEWLHLASTVAKRRGVPEGPNGRSVLLVAPTDRPGEVSERQIVQDVAKELRTAGPREWVVMVRVFRRFFPDYDTQLQVHFQATPNELKFRAGEVLDEFVLTPDEGQERIGELEAIQTLWRRVSDSDSPVRVRAIAEGMLPRPNTESYGSIDLAEIYKATQEIMAIPGGALVRLKAAADTYTRGPLELEIDVTPVGEAT